MFIKKIDDWIYNIDKKKLWIPGVMLLALTFVPYIIMGEGSVFDIHDQLDETICSYVLTARYMFSGVDVYPEVMNGLNASGMLPSAILFVPLYKILPTYAAFVLQYFVVSVTAYGGMYALIRKITGSSGIALVIGFLFALLPYKPVYGLSVVGVPLLILCFWNLYKQEKVLASFCGIVYFGLTTHLVLIGYVALTYLGIVAICLFFKRKGFSRENAYFFGGCILLAGIYCIVNYQLFMQLLFGVTEFVSHREEFVNNTEAIDVWLNIKNIFLYGDETYAPSCHWYFIPVAMIITIVQGIRYKVLSVEGKKMWKLLVVLWGIAVINAILYGLLSSSAVMEWQNGQKGLFHYFQINRYYWAYPSIWWIMIGLSIAMLWKEIPIRLATVKLLCIVVVMLPTMNLIKVSCNMYDNLNQYNHGSLYTGMPTWEEYYMQDVLEQVDNYIGREKDTYRIAHLGLNTAPSILYGYYTIDGYSNNYPLEYKHEFRKIIEKELSKSKVMQVYFDTWGSRCYLLTSETGDYKKNSEFKYYDLELNIEQMKALGCEYIFSAKEIVSNTDGMVLEGVFSTERSIYEIWLYKLK